MAIPFSSAAIGADGTAEMCLFAASGGAGSAVVNEPL